LLFWQDIKGEISKAWHGKNNQLATFSQKASHSLTLLMPAIFFLQIKTIAMPVPLVLF